MTTSKKETFLEDILDRILSNSGNLTQDIQKLRNLIQYQRSFDNHELEDILANFGQSKQNKQQISTANLPYPVAHLIFGVNEQHNELVKVLFLCDAVECFVRWRFSEMLTVIHSVKGNIPDGSLGQIPGMIDRPSMGSWISGFGHLAKQLDNATRKIWGVDQSNLKSVIDNLRTITQLRNKLAHGDISAGNNTKKYWSPIAKAAQDIFKRYAKLKITHFAVHNSKQYDATGMQLSLRGKNVPHWSHQINEDKNHYGIVHAQQSFQIPLTFKLADSSTDDSGPFQTLSYISTQGKINTPTSGGSLEYTVIDGEGIEPYKELQEFISLFKIDKDPSSQEPWKGLLKEISNAIAWDVDQALLKYRWDSASTLSTTPPIEPESKTKEDVDRCKEEIKEQILEESTPSKLWFFAGQSRSSKSTVLFSWAKKFQVRSNRSQVFVLSHRFSDSTPQNELDKFYRTLQDALTLWLREQKTLSDPDTSLTGVELRKNVASLLEQFLALEFTANKLQPSLIIALDDLEFLCNPKEDQQPILETLLVEIESWSKFTKKEVFQSGYNRERKVGIFQGKLSKQVFCVATSLDIPMGTNTTQDLDVYLKSRTHFMYDITTLSSSVPKEDDTQHHSPTEFSITLSPSQVGRWNEIVDAYQHPKHNNPPGGHLPLIGHYGAKRLLLDDNINPHLVQILQIPRGTDYINTLLNEAKGDASIIDAVGENLKKGHITIDDPITTASYDTIVPSIHNPFLQDISRLIPILVVFLKHPEFRINAASEGSDSSENKPLTATSLELLCGRGYDPTAQHESYILEALYSIPRLVKRVALSESEANGDLAFGWVLRAGADLESIFQSDVLKLTQELADKRIHDLKNKLDLLSDSLQLKSLLLQDIPSITKHSGNPVQDIFRALRGKLSGGIRTVLQNNPSNHTLQNSASMLYQSYAIAPPQITWLQKADESAQNQHTVQEFITRPAYQEFWLRHINPTRYPTFNHQITSVAYDEGIDKTICINDDFYIVVGGKPKKYTSIGIYHIERSQKELEVFSSSTAGVANDVIVHPISDHVFTVLYNIKNTVHIHVVELNTQAIEIDHHTYDYGANVEQLCSVSPTDVAIFGLRKNGKVYEIDVLNNLAQSPVGTTHATKCTKAPKFSFSHKGNHYGIYGDQLITLSNSSAVSTVCKLAAAPKFLPILIQDGIVSVGGSKNPEMNSTWYSVSRHQAIQLTDAQKNTKFNKVIFAQNLSDDRLLTVDYKGTLRIYDWNNPTPILEVQCDLPSEVLNHKTQGLNGGLLEDTTLLLYGTKSFMGFVDIAPLKSAIQNKTNPSVPHPISILLQEHYGAITGVKRVSGNFFDCTNIFLTISDDNDARLWSFSASNTGYCLGLFRGHQDKLKHISVCSDILLTTDTKQNIRTWKINQGAQNQLKSLPQRNPFFIRSLHWYKSDAWIVSTEGPSLCIEQHRNDGSSWTPQQACTLQQRPIFQSSGRPVSVDASIQLDGLLVMLLSKTAHTFDLIAQHLHPISIEDSALKLNQIHRFEEGVLGFNDTNLYIIDVLGKPHHIFNISEEEKITAACCARLEKNTYVIQFTTNTGTANKNVLEISITKDDDEWKIKSALRSLCSVQDSAAISGIQYVGGDTFFWIQRDAKPAPRLEYYLYRPSDSASPIPGPTHPLLTKGFRGLYRLPDTHGDGFAFRSGDNDRRWVLKYDYEYGEDGVSQQKVLQLDQFPSWSYPSEYLTIISKALGDYPTVLENLCIVAETVPQGVVLHYKPPSSHEARRLLWTGDSIRDFKIAQILPNGRILLKKNRDLIVLQLMKGDTQTAFEELTST